MTECMVKPELENIIKPTHDIKIFSGRSNPQLAEDIVRSGALPPLIHNLSDLDYQVKTKLVREYQEKLKDQEIIQKQQQLQAY